MKMKAGRNYGVVMVVLGLILGMFAWILLDLPFFFKVSTVAPLLVVVGAAMMAFPGGAPVVDLKNGDKLPGLSEVVRKGSGADKAIWAVAFLLGAAGSLAMTSWLRGG